MAEAALYLGHLCTKEEELLAALKRQESDACTCLVRQFTPLVYRPVSRIIYDPDDAEEVLQLTFIKACEKFHTFDARSRLSTWLYRIATNEALMLRRRQPPQQISLATITDHLLPEDMAYNLHPFIMSPVSAALDMELQTQIATALATLPPTLQSVFLLRDVQGFNTAETATTMGISEQAVKVRLHRARQQLRVLLQDYVMSGRDV